MDKKHTSVLCGGTFLTLLIEARKATVTRRNRTEGKSDAFTEADILSELVEIANPDFVKPMGDTFKTYTSNYKRCKTTHSADLNFENPTIVSAFTARIKNDYVSEINKMAVFSHRYIDIGTTAKKDVLLVKRLFELISGDDLAKRHPFFVDENGTMRFADDLFTATYVSLPAFLLGIWHFIVVNRKDNTIGADTISTWFPDKKEKKAMGTYRGINGGSIKQDIRVTCHNPTASDELEDIINKHDNKTDDSFYQSMILDENKTSHVVCIISNPPMEVDTNELLEEVGNKCRIQSCGVRLRYVEAGKTRHHYSILKICDSIQKIDSYRNSPNDDYLVLCPEHAAIYQNASNYKTNELLEIKTRWQERRDSFNRLSRLDLDYEIRHLFTNFDKERRKASRNETDLTVVKTHEKIQDTESALYDEISTYVALYFLQIKKIVSQLEREKRGFTSNAIKAQIASAYANLDRGIYTQEEIFYMLADWLRERTDSTDSTVCRIIISYYVRLCSVFKVLNEQSEE